MRFASRLYPYSITIQTGAERTELVRDNDGGQRYKTWWEVPHLEAEFRRGTVPPFNELQKALEFFDKSRGVDALGDSHERKGGVITDTSSDDFGAVFVGSDPMMRLSWFDTADVPAEHRALYEEKLLASSDCGNPGGFIRVDDAAKDAGAPFKRWADLDLERLLDVCDATGEWERALEYEQATQNRPEFVAALEARRVKSEAKAADAAMSAPAPRRTGRPPGSKNKPRDEADAAMSGAS